MLDSGVLHSIDKRGNQSIYRQLLFSHSTLQQSPDDLSGLLWSLSLLSGQFYVSILQSLLCVGYTLTLVLDFSCGLNYVQRYKSKTIEFLKTYHFILAFLVVFTNLKAIKLNMD